MHMDGHVTPITGAIGLQMQSKFENTTREFQITCQYDAFNNSARGCRTCEGEVGICDVSCRILLTGMSALCYKLMLVFCVIMHSWFVIFACAE